MALLAVAMILARLVGAGTFIVQSGSMEPAYKTGSLIFDKRVDAYELKEGDVITYAIADDMTATHRIVEISKEEPTSGDNSGTIWFTTKGDANDAADAAPVSSDNVIGMPVFQIPYLGYLIDIIKRPPSLYFAIALIAGLLLSSLLTSKSKD